MITLGQAQAQSTLAAPAASIDLADWMFTLSSDAYAACAEGHQSAAQARLPSGKRVSINVEVVAGFFMVQHYVEDLSERAHVRAVSPNTILWINDELFVLAQITWELRLVALDDVRSELTCVVIVETEDEALARTAAANNAGLDPSETPLQRHVDEETPLFAKDIERKALAGTWT